MKEWRKSLLLVANSGGHLTQLYSLEEFWSKYDHTWLTIKNEHSSFLEDLHEDVIYASGAPNRYIYKKNIIINFYKNIVLAYRIAASGRYDVVVSTGSGLGVVFIYFARLFKLKTIFIDSLSRTKKMSLSARMVRKIADINLTQWKYIEDHNEGILYKGKVI